MMPIIGKAGIEQYMEHSAAGQQTVRKQLQSTTSVKF